MSNVTSKIESLETTIEALIARVVVLEEALAQKTSPKQKNEKEMTEEDAMSVTYGDLSGLKHKDAAERTGLTYGQIYSARLGFTFKTMHAAQKAAGVANSWIKA